MDLSSLLKERTKRARTRYAESPDPGPSSSTSQRSGGSRLASVMMTDPMYMQSSALRRAINPSLTGDWDSTDMSLSEEGGSYLQQLTGGMSFTPMAAEGMPVYQEADVVSTIDQMNAGWIRREEVEKEEAKLVEQWLNRMLSKVFHMDKSTFLDGGLQAAGLGRKSLEERGMKPNEIDFLYRSLFAHSAAFHDTLMGGRGFMVHAEDAERMSAAFKLLTSFMQKEGSESLIPEGSTDQMLHYDAEVAAEKLDGKPLVIHILEESVDFISAVLTESSRFS